MMKILYTDCLATGNANIVTTTNTAKLETSFLKKVFNEDLCKAFSFVEYTKPVNWLLRRSEVILRLFLLLHMIPDGTLFMMQYQQNKMNKILTMPH